MKIFLFYSLSIILSNIFPSLSLLNSENNFRYQNNLKHELDIIKSKEAYYFKNYNLSLYEEKELKISFINTWNNIISDKAKNRYDLLLNNEYILLNILNRKFKTKIIDYNNYQISNAQFFIGKNITSNEIFIISEIEFRNLNKIISFVSNINRIKIIETNGTKNIVKSKILFKELNNKEIINIKKYVLSIEIIFKLDSVNLQKEINPEKLFDKINILNYELMIKNYGDSDGVLTAYKLENDNRNISKKNTLRKLKFFSFKDADIILINKDNNKFNLLLIIFSILNFIYVLMFIFYLFIKNFDVHIFCLEIFYFNLFYYIIYYSYTYFILKHKKFIQESLLEKMIYYLANKISLIIIVINFVGTFIVLISKLIKKIHPFFAFLRLIIIIGIAMSTVKYQIESVLWIFQIINNIIFNNKRMYPLFYIILFSIDKFTLNHLINKNIVVSKESTISFELIIEIISLIIIFLQIFYGPRFMICTKKNYIFYRSSKNLLKKNSNTKYKKCSYCLLLINNESYLGEDNIKNINDNIIIKKKELENSNKSKDNKKELFSYKRYIYNLIKKFFFEFFNESLSGIYMFIPCSHFFHESCIENIIEIGVKCPKCNEHEDSGFI